MVPRRHRRDKLPTPLFGAGASFLLQFPCRPDSAFRFTSADFIKLGRKKQYNRFRFTSDSNPVIATDQGSSKQWAARSTLTVEDIFLYDDFGSQHSAPSAAWDFAFEIDRKSV